jgi:hypothetical protein
VRRSGNEFTLADFLVIRHIHGGEWRVALKSQSVAEVYAGVMRILGNLHINVQINPMPCELPGATLFHADDVVRVYEGDVAPTYWRALVQVQCVFQNFRMRFIGKCSPIYFGAASTLPSRGFQGEGRPPHGRMAHVSDDVARDAYSHEVSNAGFWPVSGAIQGPCFYSYAYPAPPGFEKARVLPPAARFDTQQGEFLLPYEGCEPARARTSPSSISFKARMRPLPIW